MSDRRIPSSLARLGLAEARAAQILRGLGWWAEDGPTAGAGPIMWALARAPDPDLALRTVERLAETMGPGWAELDAALRTEVGLRGRLLALLGSSTALGDHLVAHPDRWHRLADGQAISAESPPDVDAYTAALLTTVGADPTEGPPGTPRGARATLVGAEAVAALQTAYRDALLEIAAADLAAVSEPAMPVMSLDVAAAALSDLATAALRAAVAVAAAELTPDPAAELPVRLGVIGMGKCGGCELNYVSDVDVIFVADPADADATRLAAATMRVAGAACLPVDANLRPEGRSGALVRTVDGHLAHYRRWATTWEFQALLKARPVAGDPELGAIYLDAVGPLVWNAVDRANFVTDVQAMRRRVLDHVRPELADRELKLGRGGLRDVEFAVQLLQLVHGRTDPLLHSPSTLAALAALAQGGYVGRDDAANLASSYRFIRLLEHRLQLQRLRRTHLLPAESDRAALRWLARAARLRPDGRRDVVGVLLGEWKQHARRVRRLHEKLFYRPLLQAVARMPADDVRLSEQSAARRLAALGYASPVGALTHLRALTNGLSRAAAIQQTLLPMLLDQLADAPDPDRGLLAYRRVSEALAETPWYLRLLRDEGAVAQRLMYLLGTSTLVADLLTRAPEVLQLLADTGPDAELATRDPAEVAASMRVAVARYPDRQEAVAAARTMRRHELLRIASADLLGLLGPEQVCAALSSVWVAVLQAAVEAAMRTQAPDGLPPARVAVIGMGRLGGAELGYGSDADVIFVYEPADGVEEATAQRFASAAAETAHRLLAAPSQDPALVLDSQLRPEGRSGPLARSLASYRAYYAQWAEVWEAQALLRARPVAGDADLGRRFIAMVNPFRYPAGGLAPAKVTEIRRIKARVDAERLPRGADRSTHTKLGYGGLADVEWTLQLLQLQHGADVPELRTTSTLTGLREATEAGLLTAEDSAALAAGWTVATLARNAIMLVRGKPGDALPSRGRDLAAVARAMGYPAAGDPGQFVDDYRRSTRRARAVVERVFYGPPEFETSSR